MPTHPCAGFPLFTDGHTSTVDRQGGGHVLSGPSGYQIFDVGISVIRLMGGFILAGTCNFRSGSDQSLVNMPQSKAEKFQDTVREADA